MKKYSTAFRFSPENKLNTYQAIHTLFREDDMLMNDQDKGRCGFLVFWMLIKIGQKMCPSMLPYKVLTFMWSFWKLCWIFCF